MYWIGILLSFGELQESRLALAISVWFLLFKKFQTLYFEGDFFYYYYSHNFCMWHMLKILWKLFRQVKVIWWLIVSDSEGKILKSWVCPGKCSFCGHIIVGTKNILYWFYRTESSSINNSAYKKWFALGYQCSYVATENRYRCDIRFH